MRKLHLYLTLILIMVSSASAVDYFSNRMNFPHGESRQHTQTLTNDGASTIKINATIPSSFSLSSTNCTQINSTLLNCTIPPSSSKYFTIDSPSSCAEGKIYKSYLTSNSTFSAEFTFVCIPDNKIIDYKVEYGHGDANYLTENYISNETATLFNLVRVWNIGHYLTPDEPAKNATIKCQYENYPVRTYGRVEIDYGAELNGTFWWNEIESGYWFRIGVVSQDVGGKAVGETYGVNCTSLTYKFAHHKVVAPFTNYTLEVRDFEPFNVTFENISGEPDKAKITIGNKEKYSAFDIFFDRLIDGYQQTQILLQLDPGETVFYKIDRSTTYNFTIHFIPPWFRNSRNPIYYAQSINFTGGSAPQINTGNPIPDVTFLEDTNYTGPDLDDHVGDPDNDDSQLNWTYSGNVNITVLINSTTHIVTFIPDPNFNGNETITFTVTDPGGLNGSDSILVTVLPVNDQPSIIGTIPDQNRGIDFNQWTLDLTSYEYDVEDSGTSLTWAITGVDNILVNASINTATDVVTFTPLTNLSGEDAVTLILYDSEGLSDSQEIVIRINMSIPLYVGWNLFSIPPVRNNSIMAVLDQLGNGNWGCGRDGNVSHCNESAGDFVGNWTSIQTYNETDGTWLVFNPTDYYLTIPSGQEIQTIEVEEGYWIEMTANDSLILDYQI